MSGPRPDTDVGSSSSHIRDLLIEDVGRKYEEIKTHLLYMLIQVADKSTGLF